MNNPSHFAGDGAAHGPSNPSSASRTARRLVKLPSRTKLRNSTWIDPQTGERTRRQFTLRHPDLGSPAENARLRPVTEGETAKEKLLMLWYNVKLAAALIWGWLNSPKGRGTIKCSVAYLIASMGTFYTPAARFLGPLDGKHIVATITVYFHPARTLGSQVEAVAIAVVAVCYAMLVGTLSMATSVLFGSVWHQVELSYALVLIVFIGGGLGFLGWVKQKLNNPLVSVGVSIASIGIITIVTKENSVHTGVFENHKIIQSLKMLLMAATISTVVNMLLWPVSARHALRNSMRTASTSLGDMLTMISHSFLSGNEEDLTSKSFTKASSVYTSTLTRLNINARESKYEYYLLGMEQIYRQDKAVVKSMESLAQSLGGLRSAANTQFELLKEISNANGWTSPTTSVFSPRFSPKSSYSFPASPKFARTRFGSLSAIDEAPDERSDREDATSHSEETTSEIQTIPASSLRTPSDIFEYFIARLGPSMKSLVYTMAGILNKPPFGAPGTPIVIQDQFKESLSEAISLYNQARATALGELYKTIEFGRTRPETVQADFEEVAAACGHFSFSLLSFAAEMQKYLDALDDLKYLVEQNKRSWDWLMFWKRISLRSKPKVEDPEQDSLIRPVRRMRQSELPQGIPDTMLKHRDSRAWDLARPAPDEEGWKDRVVRILSQGLLKFFRFLARDDIRFGLKVGIGAALYGMFAFIPQTRPIYAHWRGEWGLLTFMIVCSMTVGASNATGLARFIGTLMGAAFVLINWFITDGEVIGLAFLGWLVSFFAFYIMIDRGNGPFGRFILLTYNVSSLYAYSLTQKVEDDDDDEGGANPVITEIAYHRVVAVTMGIVWGLVICRLIWPMPARRKFKEGLAVLYLQMGLIWKRGPLAILLRSDTAAPASYMRTGEQAAMQRYAAQLQTLRAAARSEYELRGPFPYEAYGHVMASTQRLLDAFHAMSLVTRKHEGRLTPGERALLLHTAEERALLCARICHVFQVLASSIMLEHPLTDAIPSVDSTRDRLLGKIFRFRKEHSGGGGGDVLGVGGGGRLSTASASVSAATTSREQAQQIQHHKSASDSDVAPFDNITARGKSIINSKPPSSSGSDNNVRDDVIVQETDYALLYAYALVTGQVAKELKGLEREVEGLFGRLGEDTLLLQ
ncbi:hypothetical protein DL766_004094 [Monosporascus sp. MC13-8B]|nr:hypothetical protein DL766_004094 [Monosporascus sp. MC13-8B]